MILIRCPYCCELRVEEELTFGGEAGINRPDVATASDAQWADYLFSRSNIKGVHWEQWRCTAGCAQWFRVARDTVTHEITCTARYDQTFRVDEPPVLETLQPEKGRAPSPG